MPASTPCRPAGSRRSRCTVNEFTNEASPATNSPRNTGPPESPKHEPPSAFESRSLIWNVTTSSWTFFRNDVVERRSVTTICAFFVADLNAVTDQRERLVLERTLVGVERADRQQRRRRDARPLGRGRRVQDHDTLVVLLGDAQRAVPGRIRVCGAGDVVRGAGGALLRRDAGREWVKRQIGVEGDVDIGRRARPGVAGAVPRGEHHRGRDQRAGAPEAAVLRW